MRRVMFPRVALLAAVAVLAWAAAPALHADDPHQAPKAEAEHPRDAAHGGAAHGDAAHGGAAHGGAAHGDAAHGEAGHAHEPNAMHHVLDDETGKWEWSSVGPREFQLPGFTFPLFGKQINLFQLTKFKVLMLLAAALVAAIFIPLARQMAHGGAPKGIFANTFESLLTFVRDQIAKPNIGHDADKYVPFLWTLFLFILFCNLLGMIPLMGSATASIYVTLGLAICVFFAIHGYGIQKMGFVHYMESMWPHIDVPWPMGYVIKPLVFVIELTGVLVRNIVLAVRLFANMFAGHMVLATILIFIYAAATAHPAIWAGVTLGSVLGQVALSLLELFVAFLQAYIFTFLTSLFLGMALHPAH